MDFTQAMQVAHAAVHTLFGRYLTDVETAILQGTCQKQTIDYIPNDAAFIRKSLADLVDNLLFEKNIEISQQA